MQLYSVERRVSQPIEGHAASFAQMKLDGNKVRFSWIENLWNNLHWKKSKNALMMRRKHVVD